MVSTLEILTPSRVRQKLIGELYGKGRHASIRALATDLDLPYSAAHDELHRLHKDGLATQCKRGPALIFGPQLSGEQAGLVSRLAVEYLQATGMLNPADCTNITHNLRRKAGVLQFARKLRAGMQHA